MTPGGLNHGELVWVVSVSYDDADPVDYGPYTEAQAARVAAKIQGEVELATSAADGISRHPYGIRSAVATRMGRYEDVVGFLTGEKRREARRKARAAYWRERDPRFAE